MIRNKKERSISKKKPIIISCAIIIPLVVVVAAAIYLLDYYPADTDAISAFAPMQDTEYYVDDDGNVVFEPEDPTVGIIFYPGGKVEHEAYKPLMALLAQRGILSVIVDMPFNLAVFNVDAADDVKAQHPNVNRWYIGGHSLGGAMASSYLGDRHGEFEGLILLGAYSTADLSRTDLDVLSVYGSEDGVLDREAYEENRSNLPRTRFSRFRKRRFASWRPCFGFPGNTHRPSASSHRSCTED